MQRIIFLIIISAVTSFNLPLLQAESDKLKLASDKWAPFTDEVGKPRTALDLVERTLERAGVLAETQIVPTTSLMASLESGTYAGSAALWKDAAREKYLLFSEPYLQNRLVLIGRKGADVSAQSLSELKDKRIGIIDDYSYGLDRNASSGPQYVTGKNLQTNLEALIYGTLDYLLVDAMIIHYLTEARRPEVDQYLAIGKTAMVTRDLHFALRKDIPEASEIIEKFNASINKMMRDGSYHSALNINWIRADMDNDGKSELVYRNQKLGTTAPAGGFELFQDVAVMAPDLPVKQEKTGDRFWINDKAYDSWEAVPTEFKIADDDPALKVGAGADVLKFDF